MYAIMIVEDEELIRQGLTSLVDYEQFGMTVINQAENGREAWEKFQDQPADILLTDINMPQMNGLDLPISSKSSLRLVISFFDRL